MEARVQSREQRAHGLMSTMANPSNVKLVRLLQRCPQLQGKLIEGKGESVLTCGVEIWAADGTASDFEHRGIYRVYRLLDEGDSFSHGDRIALRGGKIGRLMLPD